MKNKIKYINLLITIILLLSPININAASGKYSISSNSKIEIGDSISVKFTISASKLFYWQSYITYDTGKLELTSGSTNFQGESDDAIKGQSTVTKTLKFKAKKKGTAWVSIAMGNKENNIDADGKEISFSKVTKNITIKEKTVVTYSSNNNLKSLSIDNYKISPTFNKSTLEYSVELPANTTEINVNASKEDKNSKIEGIGKIKVSEGTNKITVKVTAENGNTKNYIINAKVKELDPIEIIINNEKFNVIRKEDLLPSISSTYTKTITKINEQDVPAVYSEITKYTLVALKNNSGDINYYIYDNTKNTYNLYAEISFNKLTINPTNDLDGLKIPDSYKKETIIIDDKQFVGYTKENSYPIIIGTNIETGKKALYSYDNEENTIQKFAFSNNQTSNMINSNNENINLYIGIIAILGIILIITYLIFLINLIKKLKKNKNKKVIKK